MYKSNKEWRKRHPDRRASQRSKYYARMKKWDVRSRMPWSAEDEEIIIEHVAPDRELAKTLGRSVRAIQVRRAQIKRAYSDVD